MRLHRYYCCCSAMHGLNLKAEGGNVSISGSRMKKEMKGNKRRVHSCCL